MILLLDELQKLATLSFADNPHVLHIRCGYQLQDALLFLKLIFVVLILFIYISIMKKSIKSNKYSNAEKETLYLLKSPKNAKRLKRAINDFEANKNFKTTSLQKLK
ncbi:hypothetical protein A3306_02890 [Rickettsia bellii]|uniref:Uncharacterized protein n=3 Tax=Rickettsia bellii TaxID=33990 RepID=Q1RH24_RICBR|nr:hypothetical protein [Rickettsia bellii]ABE05340.1 unknown [Rickettsia bellii RML369-C]ABV78596.1 hypothetical protein A1I_00990 [Rickettsia bellii OSU 85-389]ARD86178.1 hypothetical protein A3306_02890 [Rickettsia bellii]